MNDLKYWAAFSKTAIIGAVRFKKIISYFPDMKSAWSAPYSELIKAGIEKHIAEELIIKIGGINPDQEMELMEKEDIKAITIKEKNYPESLKNIYDAPAIIFYKGNVNILSEPGIGVVGSRKISSYGQQSVPFLVRPLARNGLSIVSGLALGIDAIAHSTAIEENGKTAAVLGSGLDKENIYPSHNRYLAQKIIEKGGVIISEYPIGTPPLNFNFPQRNRIISGLSLGVLIIEAAERSGALITAKTALEQGREVFSVPGSIFSETSKGANGLIKKGAHPITSAEDILEILDFKKITAYNENKKIIPENPNEEKILAALSSEPMHIDAIGRNVKINAAELSSTLMLMEMKGMIKNLGGNMYVIGR